MAHRFRFYIAEGPHAGTVQLPAPEAHHALHVVRVSPGDRVTLMDGQGGFYEGAICRTTRHDVFVTIDQQRHEPCPPTRLILMQAALHSEKSTEDLIRRGTELGFSSFCFFHGARSERSPRFREKWQRIAIEACKQCGRAWLPDFSEAGTLAEALERKPSGALLVATVARTPSPIREVASGEVVTVVIGPEADLSPEELGVLEAAGGIPISLGSHIFRSEAAAITAGSLLLYELGALGPLPPRDSAPSPD